MPGPGRQPRGMKAQVKNPGELFLRLMKYVLKDYKFHCISVVVLIVVSVLCNVQGTMFMKNLIDEYITPFYYQITPIYTACTCDRQSSSILCTGCTGNIRL